jgi:hypothetical protein
VITMLDRQGASYEGYAAALLAIMEVPAIVVAIVLARVAQTAPAGGLVAVSGGGAALIGGGGTPRSGAGAVLAEVMSSKSVLLLVGGLVIGALVGPKGLQPVKPLFVSQGGAVVLGTLAASASYIAAPAAVRLALPEANPGYYLTCSLAITFPFNIVLGLPLYQAMAAALYA